MNILFNKREYKLYKGEKYYSCGGRRLHRDVYEFHYGKIEEGYVIHHVDFDPLNNDISNLIKLTHKDHSKIHEEVKTPEQLKKRITNLLENAQKEAIKWHKSKEGRKWHKEHYEKMKHKMYKTFIKKCSVCGVEFEGDHKSRFCSNKCKSKHRRDSCVDDIVVICEYCGKEFKRNKYAKTKVCSRSCSNRNGSKKRTKI